MIKTGSHTHTLVTLMSCLADRTRLRLLRLVERHELGVVELCDILQLPQSTVSRHLKLLSDQRWVRSRRNGATHLYRMVLDELDPAGRKLWLVTREQTDDWPTVRQDALRLTRRLRQRQIGSRAFFAGTAGKWDALRQELYGSSFTVAAMLAMLPSDHVVADLGCGTGQTALSLAPHVARVIGVDNSPAMLKAARKRLADCPNVSLRHGDLIAVPIDNASVDAAVLQLVLSYVAQPSVVLKEAARILKPGGKAVIVDLLPHDREDFARQMGQVAMGYSAQAIHALLAEAGLTNVRYSPLPPESGVKGPALFLAVGVR